ncbi:MAG TPA: quercetin 2,3-dioxygenase [Rubrobacteraceae bacterium]|nr:quercetin 2,3-dioxygenase [Rubrobacteraceae bacterium]
MKTGAQRATGRMYVRSAEPDNSFWYLGQLMSALAEGEDTGGRLTVYEILFPADSGPPLHVHEREDEAFYVLEGGLSVRTGDEEFEASPGSFVFQPRGVPHTFRSSADGARVLLLVVPSGFEGYFRALSRPAEAMTLPPTAGPPSAEQISAIEAALAEHGCSFVREG